jgi:hypothetical protein
MIQVYTNPTTNGIVSAICLSILFQGFSAVIHCYTRYPTLALAEEFGAVPYVL